MRRLSSCARAGSGAANAAMAARMTNRRFTIRISISINERKRRAPERQLLLRRDRQPVGGVLMKVLETPKFERRADTIGQERHHAAADVECRKHARHREGAER